MPYPRRGSRHDAIIFGSPRTSSTGFGKGHLLRLFSLGGTALRPILFQVEIVDGSTSQLTVQIGGNRKRIVRCIHRLTWFFPMIPIGCSRVASAILSLWLLEANVLTLTIAFVQESLFWLRCARQSSCSSTSWIFDRWFMIIRVTSQP